MSVGSLVFLTVLGGCGIAPLQGANLPRIGGPAADLVDLELAAELAEEAVALVDDLDALADAPAPEPVVRPAPGEAPAPRKGHFKPVGPKPDGIEQVGDKSWTVTRALANHWMDDPYSLGNARESGAGWQLVGIRTKAAYHLGMHNGDVVINANGHKLDTKPQLLAAYLDLKNDREFDVTFLRQGVTMHHHYRILD